MTDTPTLTEDGTETARLTPDDVARARRILGSMHYGGGANFRLLGRSGGIEGPVTVADLLDDLTRLSDYLELCAKSSQADSSELYELRRQRDAIRSFLSGVVE